MPMRTRPAQRGYTLLELIVSLGIFSVVILVVMGAYLTLISLDRQARANSQLATSLSFAIESMARSLRTGSEFVCNGNTNSPNCTNGGSSISFCLEGRTCRDGDSDEQYLTTYFLRSNGTIGQCSGRLCTDSASEPLTDSRIAIESLRFYVRGVGSGDGTQPQVTFVLAGSMTTDQGETTDFNIQTSATQRLLEL